jgi:hypothetical protein
VHFNIFTISRELSPLYGKKRFAQVKKAIPDRLFAIIRVRLQGGQHGKINYHGAG